MTLEVIAKQVKACTLCSLRMECTQPVPGLGAGQAEYMIIGEAPGKTEDETGIPFVGVAGKRLDRLIRLAGIDINNCYITNVCKCRPPANRQPRKKERVTCFQWLAQELDLVRPKYVITLGATPLSLFTETGIGQLHGTMFEYKEDNGMGRRFNIIAQYHPAAALHRPNLWGTMLADWEFIPEKVEASYYIAKESVFRRGI